MSLRFAAVALATLSSTVALADEGMFLPNQTAGIADKLRAAGLQMDPAKLGDLNAAPLNAIVSLGGCSAAFVSPDGLVVSNHHCVYDSIQYNSKAGQDYLTDGFMAKTGADELPATPGSRIYVIEDLRDVTTAMGRGLTARATGKARFDRLDANRKALIATCEKQASRRCDVRAYYGGARYYLQQQLEVKDVRLVYAPAGGVGNFGGETDNWMWPRHTGDWGFYRAYVGPDGASKPFDKVNVPFKPKAFLKIAKEGLKDGDFVMVAGFPGTTNREATAAEARFNFESYAPLFRRLLSDYSDLIMRDTASDKETSIRYASIVKGADNYKKKTLGEQAGAEAIDLNARKTAQETAYRSWVSADPGRVRLYGAAITDLDALIVEEQQSTLDSLRLGTLNRAQLFAAARTAYRWSKERAKPDAQRENGYQDRDRQFRVEALTRVDRRYVARVDRAIFEQALREYNGVPTARRNGGFETRMNATGLDRLYAESKLGDTATRVALLDLTAAQLEASADPFVQLAVAAYAEDIAREDAAKERSGRMQAARSAYMRGMLAFAASEGRTLYPDANGSLRFTYGRVQGRTRDGVIWTPFTTAPGFLAKVTGRGDFIAPAGVVTGMKAADFGAYAASVPGSTQPTLPINYLSTVDITNGNSGSSTLNARGEFVGLAFDGTLDGVIADWSYDPGINRTIHVDSRFMLWTMEKIDGAGRLLIEMGVK